MPKLFTVGVLLYGDHPHLAERCLGTLSLLHRRDLIDLRVGANEISPRTRAVVRGLLGPDFAGLREAAPQVYKYPMMRRLFRDPAWPVETGHLMWFDDDSYVSSGPLPWLRDCRTALARADWVGPLYSIRLTPEQQAWVKTRPWYRGLPVAPIASFAQGGWWAADAAKFAAADWPDPALRHRGGDVMAGVMCAQQGLRLASFRTGVRANADLDGRESASPRRGFDEHSAGMKLWTPYAPSPAPAAAGRVPDPATDPGRPVPGDPGPA